MEKIYEFKNGTIHILNLDNYDREQLKEATATFLKRVIIGGKKNGNSNSTRNFRKK